MQTTLLTYNIRIGTFNPLGLEGVARVIEGLRPDIVGMQEVHVYANASGPVDQPRWLAERLGLHAAFGPARDVPPRIVPQRMGQFGNALLTRFPILASETLLLPRPTLDDEQRAVLGVAVETPAGPLNVFVTHWSLQPDHRALQAMATVEFVQNWRAGAPTALMGDFNALPAAAEIAAVRAQMVDLWEAMGVSPEDRISFPAGRKGQTMPDGWAGALDYIFVDAVLAGRRIEVIHDETLASDHNPVLAVVEMAMA